MTVRAARPDEAAAIVPLYEWLFLPPGSVPPGWDAVVAVERVRGLIDSDCA
ncbi:MAG: hypothetical protein JWL79_1900, partial [Frankiales bacterium]|nr:hypothetical protein [Frankiales bacterium]